MVVIYGHVHAGHYFELQSSPFGASQRFEGTSLKITPSLVRVETRFVKKYDTIIERLGRWMLKHHRELPQFTMRYGIGSNTAFMPGQTGGQESFPNVSLCSGKAIFLRTRVMKLIPAALIIFSLVSCSEQPKKTEVPLEPVRTAIVEKTVEKPFEKVNQDTLNSIKQRGELRVGMQPGYVPFQMIGKNGNLVGLEVDLAAMAAKSLNVGLRVVRSTWPELMPSLLEGNIDVIMSGMRVTPERNQLVAFTIPFWETGRLFLVHSSNAEKYKKVQDLNNSGTFVVSGRGGLGNLRIQELLPRASFREFQDRNTALTEVLERRAHALIDDEFSIRMACSGHPGILTCRHKPITYEMMAWAVRPDDVHWLNWLDNFIRQSQGDGRLEDLRRKWIEEYIPDVGKSAN